jgi:HEAT repeat protein
MAKRGSVDERLAALRLLRDQSPSPELRAELRRALGDKSNLIVAAAAAIAGDQRLVDLAADMVRAFDRFLMEPEKSDKLCRAKIAIVQALDKLDQDQPDIYLRAARHVQMEPIWGGQEDSAPPLRVSAILALARLGHPDMLRLLVDSLTDPQKEVRIAAAQVLSEHGTETASLLLRLKARAGDGEPEVLSECLYGLLIAPSRENLPFVSEFLDSNDEGSREAAILALGKSKLPEAFDLLKACWEKDVLGQVRDEILLAMAMLRLPAATDFLLELVAAKPEATALKALSALLIYRHEPKLRERLAEAVQKSGSRALKAKLDGEP